MSKLFSSRLIEKYVDNLDKEMDNVLSPRHLEISLWNNLARI